MTNEIVKQRIIRMGHLPAVSLTLECNILDSVLQILRGFNLAAMRCI